MSRDVRKPDFCICENKDADQLRGHREADQHLCFRYRDSTTPLLPESENLKSLASISNCAARFVSDLVGNPEDRFSDVAAHMNHIAKKIQKTVCYLRSTTIICRTARASFHQIR